MKTEGARIALARAVESQHADVRLAAVAALGVGPR
jgi:hypothetical protein